ncbi:MAG: hypothetical protein ACTSRA_18000, partial [Promethearchaeota archaeon]
MITGTFFAAHLYVEIVCTFFMIAVLAGYAWAEKAKKPDDEYNCPVVIGFRAVFFIMATVFGLLFFDTIIKELGFGVLGYGNIMHFIGILIVLGVIGFELILGSVFVAPTRKGLITFVAVDITFIYLWEFYLPTRINESLEEDMIQGLYIPFIVGLCVQAISATVHKIYLVIKPRGKRDKRLWNIRPWFKKVFSLKFNVLLYALVMADTLLSFEGYGLLSWLSLDAFLGALIGCTGGILVFLVARAIYLQKKMLADEWNQKHFSKTDKLVRETEPITMPDGEVLQGYIYRSANSPGGKDSSEQPPGPA